METGQDEGEGGSCGEEQDGGDEEARFSSIGAGLGHVWGRIAGGMDVTVVVQAECGDSSLCSE